MRSFAALALILFTSALPAQENRLTPKEVTDGVLLLFDGETTFGWEERGGDMKVFKAQDGKLILSAAQVSLPFVRGAYELSFDYQLESNAKPAADLSIHAGDQLYTFQFPISKQWTPVALVCKPDTAAPAHAVTSKTLTPNLSSMIKAPEHSPLALHVVNGATLSLRNVKFKPLGLQSIFNGKDLTGWKIFEGKKSKFAVVDGAINIQDGPGDLQTEGKYANFLLQFDCISNGKHLNSGVFFRCRPNEYQNGYEAQIRNQFTPEPTQEYTVEDFDPKTRESLGKRKIQSTAFDYGTGAIYRRVPARKEVAKDGEWFTMTVAAQGNHLATWVNGIQVTDWYDNRPFADNARNGCKLEAGHISLQGHDPTTNLSFRAFRIVELPK